ncbi:SemiSWEET family transporter [uncultured Winogradskyella sp.]|uniref:SemiSWEET family transporter n=1 Tax=uncultured Winogradskyella sp. TaxID=395353 RepID=UPI00263371C7|nr:SemiSWEET family transporter [uncultured Winogradskyella sp.]
MSSLSLPMLLLFLVGVFLWLIYGWLLKSPSLILANSITIVSVLLLFIFKIKYSKK